MKNGSWTDGGNYANGGPGCFGLMILLPLLAALVAVINMYVQPVLDGLRPLLNGLAW